MTGGKNNTNAVPQENEQRLVMLGKSKEHLPYTCCQGCIAPNE